MAQGDLTIFDEAKLALLDGTHDLNTDVIKVAFITNGTVPAAADLTPVLGDYTESSPLTGNYPGAGGFTMTATLVEVGGTVTYDYTTNIAMAKNALNPTNVYYALIYNTSKTNQAIGFVEVNAAGADGTVGAINVTWGANIFTLT